MFYSYCSMCENWANSYKTHTQPLFVLQKELWELSQNQMIENNTWLIHKTIGTSISGFSWLQGSANYVAIKCIIICHLAKFWICLEKETVNMNSEECLEKIMASTFTKIRCISIKGWIYGIVFRIHLKDARLLRGLKEYLKHLWKGNFMGFFKFLFVFTSVYVNEVERLLS